MYSDSDHPPIAIVLIRWKRRVQTLFLLILHGLREDDDVGPKWIPMPFHDRVFGIALIVVLSGFPIIVLVSIQSNPLGGSYTLNSAHSVHAREGRRMNGLEKACVQVPSDHGGLFYVVVA